MVLFVNINLNNSQRKIHLKILWVELFSVFSTYISTISKKCTYVRWRSRSYIVPGGICKSWITYGKNLRDSLDRLQRQQEEQWVSQKESAFGLQSLASLDLVSFLESFIITGSSNYVFLSFLCNENVLPMWPFPFHDISIN